MSLQELDKLGFRLVIYANSAMRAATFAAQGLLRDLQKYGDTSRWVDKMITWEERKRVTHLFEVMELERRYAA